MAGGGAVSNAGGLSDCGVGPTLQLALPYSSLVGDEDGACESRCVCVRLLRVAQSAGG